MSFHITMSFHVTQFSQERRCYPSGVELASTERLIAALYGDGHTMPQIALVLDTTMHMVRSQVLRVRSKY